ncbi:MAG: UbiX family flavin prenyltransferase [Pirellulaceae bacterium]|nr:UbiX family flavin prenyltransferase [Pirellulaceae bacterium]
MNKKDRPIVVAITGASGVLYSLRLLETLLRLKKRVHLTISKSGFAVLGHEYGVKADPANFSIADLFTTNYPFAWQPTAEETTYLRYDSVDDFFAPMASGSHQTAGMVICPSSGATTSAIARGASSNLIHRAAEVHLKEKRKLVLVPRETPMSVIQLQNLTDLARLGTVILPASPGFYQGGKTVADLIDFVVARILDQLEVEHTLSTRWGDSC